MLKQEMLRIVQLQLATNMNCSPSDFDSSNNSVIFTDAKDNPGRMPFPRGERHLEMLSMGKSVVVTATPDILGVVKPLLEGKSRDEVFSMPFVCGHGLLYLPDVAQLKPMVPPDGFAYETFTRSQIPALYIYEGFRNAIGRDVNHPRPDVLAITAQKDGQVVAIAGAGNDCAKMWQIGIDVLPEYRQLGLAVYLVNQMTLEILERGYIPYYGTAPSNIASQRVARRVGYEPAWVHAFRFDYDSF
jgi:GNAT superfamily N-acetyltransferase